MQVITLSVVDRRARCRLIDHWNNEHERIVVLTERSFYIIRYDFLSGHIRESKRVGLGQLVSVTTGPLVFPTKSLMP
ncbi:Tumor protein p63-regulated gene 1-like protein [Taenia solium]|eukprot:TsM_001056100 transcript=TsM_001056100 gene=TsM_001056100